MITPPKKNTMHLPTNAPVWRSAIWGCLTIVVLAILVVSSLPRTHEEELPKESKSGKIAEVIPVARPEAPAMVEEVCEDVIDPKKLPDPAYDKKLHPSLPPKKYIPTVEEVENARLGPDGKPRPMSIYKSPAEQAMGVIFSTELGAPPPVLPNIPQCTSEEQLQDFLERTFAYDKDAPREVNENRIMMEQVQSELKEYLNDGGDIGGFIDFYVGELRACHEQWKTARNMLVDMARAGEAPETLRQFRNSANALLAERGIRALTIPPSVRARMEED